jgi:serine/threonine protein kinase
MPWTFFTRTASPILVSNIFEITCQFRPLISQNPDIKPDNVQLTLPEEEDSFLDDFCANEKSSPSPSKPGRDESHIVASREMIHEDFGYAILCDFGSAFPDDQTWDGEAQSLPYRAPEVILGAEWDHKLDIWNIGVLVSVFFCQDIIWPCVLTASDLATHV